MSSNLLRASILMGRFAGICVVSLLATTGLVQIGSAAENSAHTLSELPASQRSWVEESCPATFGPSLYTNCIRREIAAIRSGVPDLSGLQEGNRQWVQRSCPRSFGPSLYISCVRREIHALDAGIPDLSHLQPESRAWVENSCPRSFGPSLYIACLRRESQALGTEASVPGRSAPRMQPEPNPAPPKPQHSLSFTSFRWPPWQGERPVMPQPMQNSSYEPSDLFRRVGASVYVLVAADRLSTLLNNPESVAQGSAVAVSPEHLVTNCHVIENRPEILVIRNESVGKATVLRADPQSDRCFLRVVDLELTPIGGMRGYRDLAIGERVYSIGAPSGLDNTLGEGLISGLRHAGTRQLIQTSAPISPGSSGGGLFDVRGNLIGITTLMIRDAQNLNFAIAAEDFWNVR